VLEFLWRLSGCDWWWLKLILWRLWVVVFGLVLVVMRRVQASRLAGEKGRRG